MEKEPKNYEIGFLVKSENDRDEVIKTLESQGGLIVDNGNLTKIRLAYPIKKEHSAYFGYLYFSVQSEIIERIISAFRLNQKILRFLITISSLVKPFKFSGAKEKKASSRLAVVFPRTKKIEIQKPKLTETKEVSNEALEKKLEEILK